MKRTPFKRSTKPMASRKQVRKVSAKKTAYNASDTGVAGRAWMGQVARLQCACCAAMGRVQCSPTEVHHCKSGRYGSARESDLKTIPLCHSHHNKLRQYPGDEGITGFHNGQETWESQFGPDHGFLDWVADQVAMLD